MENKMSTQEVKEIEVFSIEQLQILPQDAKESIILLSNNLPTKELLVLNPLVTKLLQIKKLEEIVYTPLPENPTKEDVAAHKENIQEFKSALKDITGLKQQAGQAKTAIKKPLDNLGKQVLVIEKSINNLANEISEKIKNKFKPYLDAEAEKAAAALAAKQAKEKEAINALEKQNEAQALLFQKSTLTTFLKYEMLEATKKEVQNALATYSKEALFELRGSFNFKTFEFFTKEKNISLIPPDELTPIREHFNSEINTMIASINNAIKTKELEATNERLIEEVAPEQPPIEAQMLMANMDAFELANSKTAVPFGVGANPNTVQREIYPSNENEVDFLDLVIKEINECKERVSYIYKRYTESKTNFSDQEKENIRRVRGGIQLLGKVVLYILNQLPTKQ